jgi:hypothetical protein
MSRSQLIQETYLGWDSEVGLRWKVEDSSSLQWEHTDSIITAWKSRVRRDSAECMIKILVDQIAIICDNFASYNTIES